MAEVFPPQRHPEGDDGAPMSALNFYFIADLAGHRQAHPATVDPGSAQGPLCARTPVSPVAYLRHDHGLFGVA